MSRAAAAKASGQHYGVDKGGKKNKVSLTAAETLQALEGMTAKEKKEIRKALQAQEDDFVPRQSSTALSSELRLDYEFGGYSGRVGEPQSYFMGQYEVDQMRSGQKGYPVASGQLPLRARPKLEIVAPSQTDERGREKATAVKKRELEEFRRSLYEQAWDGRRVKPSSAAPVPTDGSTSCCGEPTITPIMPAVKLATSST